MEEFLAYLGRVLSIFDPRETKKVWDSMSSQQKEEILSVYTGSNPVSEDFSTQAASRLASDTQTKVGEIWSQLASAYPSIQNQPTNVIQQLYAEVVAKVKEGASATDIFTYFPTRANEIISAAQKNPLIQGEKAPQGAWDSFTVLPNGNRMDPSTGKIFDANGNLISSGGAVRTAAEDNAANASAAANYAQAEKIRDEIARNAVIQAGINSGTLIPTSVDGVFYTPDGKIFNKTEIDVAKARLAVESGRLTEDVRNNKAREALDRLRINNDATYQQGQLGIGQEGNRLRGQEIQNTYAYNQARLGFDVSAKQADLEQGAQRLGLDTEVARLNAQDKAQQNNLARQMYISKVLASPSDFIARAFMQRGEASPTARITQADLINQVNNEYTKAPTSFTASSLAPGGPNALSMQPSLPVQGYAEGTGHGMVNDRLAIVGDSQVPGVPNPEVIHNPTGAPISITPMNRLAPEQASQPKEAANTVDPEEKRAEALSRLLQNVKNPDTMHALVDEIADARGRLKAYAEGTDSGGTSTSIGWTPGVGFTVGGGQALTGTLAEAAANSGFSAPTAPSAPTDGVSMIGTAKVNPNYLEQNMAAGLAINKLIPPSYTYNTPRLVRPEIPMTRIAPELPPIPAVSQEEILAKAENTLPPALRQLFGGDATQKPFNTVGGRLNPENPTGINPLKFGFNLFSPQMLAQLTNAEKEALNSYLGVKYNTSLEDVLSGMQQSFGRPATRTGRLAIG